MGRRRRRRWRSFPIVVPIFLNLLGLALSPNLNYISIMSQIPSPIIISTRPQNAGNLGALARVMSNFELAELRIVGEKPTGDATPEFSKMDWAMACKGEPVLANAQIYPTLKEALHDCHSALGTSGKIDAYDLGYSRPFKTPAEAFKELMIDAAPILSSTEDNHFKWALVFGCESDGLTAEEASFCKQLIQIDTADKSPSINLAMAAGLLIYHFHLLCKSEDSESHPSRTETKSQNVFGAFELNKGEEWATLGDKEKFIESLIDALKLTQFFKYPDESSVSGRFRRFFQSMPIPRGELLLGFEAIYQLKSWGQGKFEKRSFLK